MHLKLPGRTNEKYFPPDFPGNRRPSAKKSPHHHIQGRIQEYLLWTTSDELPVSKIRSFISFRTVFCQHAEKTACRFFSGRLFSMNHFGKMKENESVLFLPAAPLRFRPVYVCSTNPVYRPYCFLPRLRETACTRVLSHLCPVCPARLAVFVCRCFDHDKIELPSDDRPFLCPLPPQEFLSPYNHGLLPVVRFPPVNETASGRSPGLRRVLPRLQPSIPFIFFTVRFTSEPKLPGNVSPCIQVPSFIRRSASAAHIYEKAGALFRAPAYPETIRSRIPSFSQISNISLTEKSSAASRTTRS